MTCFSRSASPFLVILLLLAALISVTNGSFNLPRSASMLTKSVVTVRKLNGELLTVVPGGTSAVTGCGIYDAVCNQLDSAVIYRGISLATFVVPLKFGKRASLAGAVAKHSSGKSVAMFAGAYFSTPSNTIEIFDAETESFIDHAARLSFTAASLDAATYVNGAKVETIAFGGGVRIEDGQKSNPFIDIFDPFTLSRTTITAPVSVTNGNLAATIDLTGESYLILAGGVLDVPNEATSIVQMYRTSTGTWSNSNLSQARFNMAVAVVSNGVGNQKTVLFCGGLISLASLSVCDVLNADLTWTSFFMNSGRSSMGVGVFDHMAVFVGSWTWGVFGNEYGNPFSYYNGVTRAWTDSTLSTRRAYGGAGVTISNNGFQLLAIGGNINDMAQTNSVEHISLIDARVVSSIAAIFQSSTAAIFASSVAAFQAIFQSSTSAISASSAAAYRIIFQSSTSAISASSAAAYQIIFQSSTSAISASSAAAYQIIFQSSTSAISAASAAAYQVIFRSSTSAISASSVSAAIFQSSTSAISASSFQAISASSVSVAIFQSSTSAISASSVSASVANFQSSTSAVSASSVSAVLFSSASATSVQIAHFQSSTSAISASSASAYQASVSDFQYSTSDYEVSSSSFQVEYEESITSAHSVRERRSSQSAMIASSIAWFNAQNATASSSTVMIASAAGGALLLLLLLILLAAFIRRRQRKQLQSSELIVSNASFDSRVALVPNPLIYEKQQSEEVYSSPKHAEASNGHYDALIGSDGIYSDVACPSKSYDVLRNPGKANFTPVITYSIGVNGSSSYDTLRNPDEPDFTTAETYTLENKTSGIVYESVNVVGSENYATVTSN